MKYTAENFKKDVSNTVIAYLNDPSKALNRLKRLHGKMKSIIEKKYSYKLGKIYTEKEGKNYFVVFPVFGEGAEGDILWEKIEKDVSREMYDLIDIAKLDNIWGMEGQRPADSGSGIDDLVEVLFYLK